ncbi:hypothetical protein HGH92_11055 [Chitinophaga varians]|uniref:Antirepressor protein C-terminal domain-containing protein n=1 Tax=Chitinophaga varians TaxID=2202339 RepID=A0A847RPJ2_9BACT|nr:phage antirepressor KilAC domain-containing protein [Chitinophaga varians]NLR64842.1 hypothetical protein [Chitinophaga varians]
MTMNTIPLQDEWFDMKKAAKLLNAKMGRTKLYRYLREEGVLMSDNEPYQQYVDAGYFKLITKDIRGRMGQLLFRQPVTLVSMKGVDFIKTKISRSADDGKK